MNGVHDMGGMQGMGPIQPEKTSRCSMRAGKGAYWRMSRAMGARGKWNSDASRPAIESIPAADYLRMSYYERWFTGLVEQLVGSGLVTRAEDRERQAGAGSAKSDPAAQPRQCRDAAPWSDSAHAGRGGEAALSQPASACARATCNPVGHTRLPRYARGKDGRHRSRSRRLSLSRTPTPIFPATSRSTSIRCASRRASCGASRRRRTMPSTSICGTTTLSQPDISDRCASAPAARRGWAGLCRALGSPGFRPRREALRAGAFHLERMGGSTSRGAQGSRRSRRTRRRYALLPPLAGGARTPGYGEAIVRSLRACGTKGSLGRRVPPHSPRQAGGASRLAFGSGTRLSAIR